MTDALRDAAARAERWLDGRARLVRLARHVDARGTLSSFDYADLPFVPMRVFTVSAMTANTVRGGHGHRTARQLLVCVHGRIRVRMACPPDEAVVTLEPGGPGLLIDAGVWSEQTYLEDDSVMLALCSEPFDPASYFQREHPER